MTASKGQFVFAVCVLLGACKPITDPELTLPQQLSHGEFQISKYTQTIEFNTVVPRAKGTYQLGPWSGTFDRSAHGFSMTDSMHDRREFVAHFTVSGPNLDVPVTVDCKFALGGTVDGVVSRSSSRSASTTRAAYRCAYASGDYEDEGDLVLAQPHSAGRNKRHNHLRVGRSAFNGSEIEIASVHTSPDIPISVDDPLGFVLTSAQGAVASINLRQRNFRLRQDVSVDLKRNAVFAALSLIMQSRPQD